MLPSITNWKTQPAPRYTSYPTAPWFQEAIDSTIYQTWLTALPEDASLSLYFHIPFCEKLCWFCGCHTSIVHHYKPVSEYLEFLLLEIKKTAAMLPTKRVTHIHFGGGSPSFLKPDDFDRLMETVQAHFNVDPSAEIALEIDPRTSTPEKLASYKKWNLNRMSLGIQDFDEKVQKAINRVQPFDLVKNLIDDLHAHDITSINADLIYGLPHQTLESFSDTVQKTIALNPDRIALFSYAHVPWMKKHQQLIKDTERPGTEENLALFQMADRLFQAHGYRPIGFDHFAKEKDSLSVAMQEKRLHRNFQGYSVDPADVLLGFGPSAISTLPQGYVQNAPHMKAYRDAVSNDTLPVSRGILCSDEDRLRRAVIEALMCYMDVDLAEMAQKHGFAPDFFAPEREALLSVKDDSLFTISEDFHLKITTPFRMVVRAVCTVFDSYFQDSTTQRHSKIA